MKKRALSVIITFGLMALFIYTAVNDTLPDAIYYLLLGISSFMFGLVIYNAVRYWLNDFLDDE